MQVIANRQLFGDYGAVVAGQQFECQDDVANELIARSLVRRLEAPKVAYEVKVIVPEAPEVAAAREPEPFRSDVPLPDPEPQGMAPEGNRVLPGSDVRQERPANRGRRRGRE